jgi:hypothetical protein
VQLSNQSSNPSASNNQPKEPEHEVVSTFDLSEMPQPELTGHAWRQRGTELVCDSCPFTHSSYIPPNMELYGINDKGYPMFRQRY